ncbi:hypothetical protein ABPG74_005443 [Tetrahymena malaccensis]
MEESKGVQFFDVESFPPQKLFELAEENFVKVNYADAEYYYQLCIKKDPEQEEAVSQYAECLKTQGKFEQSIEVLKSAIENRFNKSGAHGGDYKKYLQLAELMDGEESIKLYEQGIKLIQEGVLNGTLSHEDKDVKRDLSEAFSGLAEVFQTDFLHLAESEPKVVECIQKAMEADPTALDAHLQQTNYYLNKENEEEAKKSIKIVIDGLTTLKEDDDSYDDSFKLNAAKLCVEIGEFSLPISILETLVLSNDSNYEAYYMLAFCHYKTQNFYTALEYTESLLAKKDLQEDEEIFTATQELKDELDKQDFNQAKDANDMEGQEEGEDEDWMDLE